jgi:2'-5' RNA ligase
MRAFAAIELDAALIQSLDEAARAMQAAKPPLKLRWVEAEHQHLTLHFFGEIDAQRVDEITQALQLAASRVAPFEISLADIGCFPNIYKPNVLWVGIHESSGALKRLYKEVGAELARIEFVTESGAFMPHLTLARVARDAGVQEKKALGEWFVQRARPAPARLRVTQLHLMRSELLPSGSRYTTLSSVRFAGM